MLFGKSKNPGSSFMNMQSFNLVIRQTIEYTIAIIQTQTNKNMNQLVYSILCKILAKLSYFRKLPVARFDMGRYVGFKCHMLVKGSSKIMCRACGFDNTGHSISMFPACREGVIMTSPVLSSLSCNLFSCIHLLISAD